MLKGLKLSIAVAAVIAILFSVLVGAMVVRLLWMSKTQYRVKLVIPPGYLGEATAIRDPKVKVGGDGILTLRVKDGIVRVPPDFLPKKPQAINFRIVGIVDTKGKVLSLGSDDNQSTVIASLGHKTGERRWYWAFHRAAR